MNYRSPPLASPLRLGDREQAALALRSPRVPAVEGLVQKGYIYKERDPNDRRRYLLYLTAAAHEFLSDMHAVTEDDPLLIAVAELGEADSKQLLHLLRKVIQTIPQGENMLCEIQTRLNPQKIATSELD
jgi:DNA-binding MarR family transcriptional regulator